MHTSVRCANFAFLFCETMLSAVTVSGSQPVMCTVHDSSIKWNMLNHIHTQTHLLTPPQKQITYNTVENTSANIWAHKQNVMDKWKYETKPKNLRLHFLQMEMACAVVVLSILCFHVSEMNYEHIFISIWIRRDSFYHEHIRTVDIITNQYAYALCIHMYVFFVRRMRIAFS